MRTQTLLVIVMTVLVASGCSARRGAWWPFAGSDQYVESGDQLAPQWTGVESDVSPQNYPSGRRGWAWLNPFSRKRIAGQMQYEGEVIARHNCRGCGMPGQFAGNGKCDNCLGESVNGVLGENGVIEAVQDPGELAVPLDPTTFGNRGIPAAPEMQLFGSGKVVKPHPALTDRMTEPNDSGWQSKEFQPFTPELSGYGSTRSNAQVDDATPQVPTTMIQDQRMNKYESPIPNWDGWDGKQENLKPARVVNQFNDDIDWSKLARPRSIAMSPAQKTGGEPVLQVRTYGAKSRVIEIQPDQPRDHLLPVQQDDPKFEQFTLDDLFPPDLPIPVSNKAAQQSNSAESNSDPRLQPTASEPMPDSTEPAAKSIMEDDNIEWGLPNQLESPIDESSNRRTLERGEKKYTLIDEHEQGAQSRREEERYQEERSESERKQSEQGYEDESLYEDEEGRYDQDADFSQPGAHDFGQVDLSTRSERDIIEELRHSTVPNGIVFDNTQQMTQLRAQEPAKPVVLTAKPVPHYQELRRLAELHEEGTVDISNQKLPIENLPRERTTPATPASSRRVVQETDSFDFQPLPNLTLPDTTGLEYFDLEDLESQAFDPEIILNTDPPTALQIQEVGNPRDISVQMVDGMPKRNAVPIILKAAPTFVESEEPSEANGTAKSNARIRFIKPSYQREWND